MKKLLSFGLLLLIVTAVAAGDKSELVMDYKILKDSTDASVATGKCKISGVALFDGSPVANALVYGERTRSVRTNSKGEFEIVVEYTEQYLIVAMDSVRQGYLEGYKFNSGHHIECEIYVRNINDIFIVDKPVIYLYSEDNISVNIGLKTDMELLFTYPQLSENKDWKVDVGSEGIRNKDGRSFPYLFWEGRTTNLSYKNSEGAIVGELVKTDSIVSYLEEKLLRFGLNSTELTDFITYWAPRMVQYEYVITQFDLNELVSSMAELEVTPTPDHQRRLYMLFTGFDTEPEIKLTAPDADVKPLERSGFTLLEWGGSEVNKNQLIKTL